MKNIKITAEEQDIDKLRELFVLKERLVDKKMVGNIMSIRQTNVHYLVPMFEQLG